jgi:hypothetical protein
MAFQSPPIVKLAERMLLEIERAVRHFSRYHKYQHGAVLRERAMRVAEAAHLAWRERGAVHRIEQLVDAVDSLKIALQLGQQIKAFASWRQFEALGRLHTELGRQCGGWLKTRRVNGQNASARSHGQRAEILSPRAAHGANA